ncbi:MAG TPA: ABC transporter permease [Kofleriaceae bacterium]|nr:ABC transporter permease [Kofleriaceae bacterium]
MRSILLDLRYSLRMMGKTPGLTLILVLTLALGIGASTTIFSVVHSVVLRDLPYREPDRLVRVYTEFRAGKDVQHRFSFSVPEIGELQQACRSCAMTAGWLQGTAPLSGGDRPVRIAVGYATHQLLPLLGVPPILGRWFDANEDAPQPWVPGAQIVGDPDVLVINYEIWRDVFHGDPNVIGRKVELDAIPVTIIGVMPRGFQFDGMEAWVPARLDFSMQRRGSHAGNVLVRLAPGASIDSLNDELAALTRQWGTRDSKQFHSISVDHPVVATPFKQDLVGSLASVLWTLQAAVLFVLLISIVNVANLLLARAETRTREIAVRHALGASRRRLLRQFITESLVIGLLGAGLGILLSVWALDGVTALVPKSAPRASEISFDGTAVVFAVCCSVGAALLFGLAPILHAKKSDLHGALKDGGNQTTGSRARLRVRRVLVIVEIALAMLLVIGCTVMVRAFVRLSRVELGFQPDHVLTFGVNLPLRTYTQPADAMRFWDRLEARLDALPGVEGAALVPSVGTDRGLNIETIRFPGRTEPSRDEPPWNVDFASHVSANTLTVLGAKLVRGRDLANTDTATSPLVVVVNQAFVDKFLPGEDPIGKEVVVYPQRDPAKDKPARIVGVFANLKNQGLDKPAGTELYIPRVQMATLFDPPISPLILYGVVRTTGDPGEAVPAVSRAVAEIDPTVPIYDVRTFDEVLWEAVARPRFLTWLLSAFALVAFVLAAVGIYGVMAHTVVQRTHEIGLRVALGAQPRQVRRLVMRQAGSLVLIGVGVGLVAVVALQVALGDSLASFFYGETLGQPLLLGGVALVVAATAVLATWVPARRATKVEPTVALRSD